MPLSFFSFFLPFFLTLAAELSRGVTRAANVAGPRSRLRHGRAAAAAHHRGSPPTVTMHGGIPHGAREELAFAAQQPPHTDFVDGAGARERRRE
uniref:Secreted protein n=1 Tax=Oryza nivara TaxID=4536 RepID=A0A0E0HBF0_ORYNI